MNQTPIERAGAGRPSFKAYVTGFLLAIVLTVISFALVMKGGGLPYWAVLYGIFGAAVLQILVHLHYFLHLDASSAARWNMLALLITLFIMLEFIGLTLWLMFDLHYRMM
ncbi:MAG: cytochrome o ubiquinol oxidase subunit IV [Desulfobacterales bacterium]